ncbi:hypothetical protein [Hoyosella subflava]|uniref:hypothetical protein n=1 Tax=Hoyosella subflava TaxID=639313 RepID=UPI0011D1F87E|nr:hypothetical protein [Hoyosella subflava]
MGIFHPGIRTVSSLDPRIGASLYPQTVSLTRLLASPYWHSLPAQSSHAKHAFIREVRATVAPNYRWKPKATTAQEIHSSSTTSTATQRHREPPKQRTNHRRNGIRRPGETTEPGPVPQLT